MRNRLTATMREEKRENGTIVLYSYRTPVAAKLPDGTYVKTSRKWSQTTSCHISRWCPVILTETVSQEEIDKL